MPKSGADTDKSIEPIYQKNCLFKKQIDAKVRAISELEKKAFGKPQRVHYKAMLRN